MHGFLGIRLLYRKINRRCPRSRGRCISWNYGSLRRRKVKRCGIRLSRHRRRHYLLRFSGRAANLVSAYEYETVRIVPMNSLRLQRTVLHHLNDVCGGLVAGRPVLSFCHLEVLG